jgi:hypothetical protein
MPQLCRGTFCRYLDSNRSPLILGGILMLAFLMVPQAAKAQRTWNANPAQRDLDQRRRQDPVDLAA